MATPDSSQSVADKSRLAVALIHLGDGIMLGTVFYFAVALVLFLFSRFFAQSVGDHPGLAGIVAVALLIFVGRLFAVGQSGEFRETLQIWAGKRQLRWVAVISLLIAGFLFGISLLGGWRAIASFIFPYFLSVPVIGIGFGLRLVGDYLI